MVSFSVIAVLAELTVFRFGLVVVRLAYRAYRRTGLPALRSLALAFGLITLGALLGGDVDRLLDLEQETGILVDIVLTTAGFAVLLHALYVMDSTPESGERPTS